MQATANADEIELPAKMQTELEKRLSESNMAEIGNKIPTSHERSISTTAVLVFNPVFLKGLRTIQTNLSSAINIVNNDDSSNDARISTPAVLHTTDCFHFMEM